MCRRKGLEIEFQRRRTKVAESGMPAVVALVAVEGGTIGCWRPLGHRHMMLAVGIKDRTRCLVVLLLVLRLPLAVHRLFLLERGNLFLGQPYSKEETKALNSCLGGGPDNASAGPCERASSPSLHTIQRPRQALRHVSPFSLQYASNET